MEDNDHNRPEAMTESPPEKSTFDVNENKPHPNANCPVCGAAKMVFRTACSEICEDLERWLDAQPKP